MYIAKKFDSLYYLQDFLNENKIKPTKIIGIYRLPVSSYAGKYELLYYVEDDRK